MKYRGIDADVEDFCGWDFLMKLFTVTSSNFLQGLMAGIFGTGGRISEVLSLRKNMVLIDLHSDIIVIQNMPLLKRFEKVKGNAGNVTKWKCKDHCKKRWNNQPTPEEYKIHNIVEYVGWITKPIKDYRTFPIRKDELTTPYFIAWYEQVRGDNDLLYPISRSTAFNKIRDIGKRLDMEIPFSNIPSSQLYVHWWRAQRACQLAFDYGFDDDDLDRFFGWKERRPRMSKKYASRGWIGMARRMGVDV